MPFIQTGIVGDILGMTAQNFNLLMGVSGIVCAGLIIVIWARGL